MNITHITHLRDGGVATSFGFPLHLTQDAHHSEDSEPLGLPNVTDTPWL